MDLRVIIDQIAREADDFLDGFTGRADARAGISEYITLHYGTLSHADREKVIDGVAGILEQEGFFDGVSGGENDGRKSAGGGDESDED